MQPVVVPIDFEWDLNKEAINIGKHGVSFSEATKLLLMKAVL